MNGNRSVLVLGSTGSIGTQALELIAAPPGALHRRRAGRGRRRRRAARRQVRAHDVRRGGGGRPTAAARGALRELLPGVEVLAGPDAATELTATAAADVGAQRHHRVGRPRAHAGRAAPRARRSRWPTRSRWSRAVRWSPAAAAPGQIVPVDSEHSALAQCLRGGRAEEVDRLVLTASGRPVPRAAARRAGRRHRRRRRWPTRPGTWARWSRINSATLINKGLELIEAHLLFGMPVRPDRRGRAPAVDRALDGHVRRRLHARPGQPAGHAAADRARAGLAGAAAGRGAAVPLGHRAELDVRAARRRRVPRRAAGPGGRDARAAACPPCSTRPTRRPSGRSSRAPARSPGITDTLERVLDAADGVDGRSGYRGGRAGRRGMGARPRRASSPARSAEESPDDDRPRDRAVLPRDPDLDRLARAGPLHHRALVRHQGAGVHGRLRQHDLVAEGRRDRVRAQGHPARRLHPHDRHDPARQGRDAGPQPAHRPVPGPDRRRPAAVGDGRAARGRTTASSGCARRGSASS